MWAFSLLFPLLAPNKIVDFKGVESTPKEKKYTGSYISTHLIFKY